MSHASSSKICKYDVFLNFRGVDTRKNIVSHLYNALQRRGISTFKDDERLETGKSIPDELLKAIGEARFAVVIFSKSYATSRWCLEELAHIIKCKNELEQIVIPVFYDVSPSDVCHQNPPFADSFSQHEVKYKDDMEKVQRWRDAFVEAGQLSGYHLVNLKDEAECIKKIVDDICSKSLQVISPSPKRFEQLYSQLDSLDKTTNLLRRTMFQNEHRVERGLSDLQLAQAEVDILGDEVDTLLRLVEKIYIVLDHYSPVLQHYPGIMEILEVIKRELTGESTKLVKSSPA